jgi:thioesterase domain-containing protein
LSRRDAFEVARILEAHGQSMWDAGLRDARPPQVKLEPHAAVWSSLRLRLAERHGMIELVRALEAEALLLRLVELVEVIQVLDWLAGGSSVSAWPSPSARSQPPESSS